MRVSSAGSRVAWSGSRSSQVVTDGVVVRSSGVSYNSDNGGIRPQPRHDQAAFPQLSSYFDPEFFMGK
jgi:hypothetical protein